MKTKKQLLAAMRNHKRWACADAYAYVLAHSSNSALQIGLRCTKKCWLVWFLYRTLDADGRALFAARLGLRGGDSDLWDAGQLSAYAKQLSRAVIDDCWRAWCGS